MTTCEANTAKSSLVIEPTPSDEELAIIVAVLSGRPVNSLPEPALASEWVARARVEALTAHERWLRHVKNELSS
jgi:hypothetical protein